MAYGLRQYGYYSEESNPMLRLLRCTRNDLLSLSF